MLYMIHTLEILTLGIQLAVLLKFDFQIHKVQKSVEHFFAVFDLTVIGAHENYTVSPPD